ncbi:hypothetical protein GCM10009682_18460 [Luedemannella flava]|uniref:Uncharacterized protein n=1 Tax=Luedemannella flava TaxID=349316 RepID=A0ABP4Y2U7_9ACTN
MDAWAPEENLNIGKRRAQRMKRRMEEKRPVAWTLRILVVLVVLALAGGAVWWFTRPSGLATLPPQALDTPGGFRSDIGEDNTVTVGVTITNTATKPVTVGRARIVAPPGVKSLSVGLVAAGDGNAGFELNGDVPKGGELTLTPGQAAIIVGRFTVTCGTVIASAEPTDEQIFATVQVDGESREEELDVPVVGDMPWLTATAQRSCLDPVPTGDPGGPLKPLPKATEGTS